MRPRMLCMDCGETAHPDSLIAGSDRLEMLLWLCFALPGWLYSGWRHLTRTKACSACGGRELMRECHAAASRRPPEAPRVPYAAIRVAGGALWPRELACPRRRLELGAPGALLWLVLLVAWSAVGLGAAPWFGALPISTVLCALWLVVHALRVVQLKGAVSRCRAWDAEGRPLRIEMV